MGLFPSSAKPVPPDPAASDAGVDSPERSQLPTHAPQARELSTAGDLATDPTGNLEIDPTVDSAMSSTVDPAIDPAVDLAMNPAVSPAIDPAVSSTVSPAIGWAMSPAVNPAIDPAVDLAMNPAVDLAISPAINPAIDPAVSPAIDPAVDLAMNPAVSPAINPAIDPAVDLAMNPAVSPAIGWAMSPAVNPAIDPAINPAVDLAINPAMSPAINPAIDPAVDLAMSPAVNPAIDPAVSSTVSPAIGWAMSPAVNPAMNPAIDPTINPAQVAAVAGTGAVGVGTAETGTDPALVVLYDGWSDRCCREVEFWRQRDRGRGLVTFLEIHSADYVPRLYGGRGVEDLEDQLRGWLGEGFLLGEWQTCETLPEILGRHWFDRWRSLPGLGLIVRWLTNPSLVEDPVAVFDRLFSPAPLPAWGEGETDEVKLEKTAIDRVTIGESDAEPPKTEVAAELDLKALEKMLSEAFKWLEADVETVDSDVDPAVTSVAIAATIGGSALGPDSTAGSETVTAESSGDFSAVVEELAVETPEAVTENLEGEFSELDALLAVNPEIAGRTITPETSETLEVSRSQQLAESLDHINAETVAPSRWEGLFLDALRIPVVTEDLEEPEVQLSPALAGPIDPGISQALEHPQQPSKTSQPGLKIPVGTINQLYCTQSSFQHLFTDWGTVAEAQSDSAQSAAIQFFPPIAAATTDDRPLVIARDQWVEMQQRMAQIIHDRRALEAVNHDLQRQIQQLLETVTLLQLNPGFQPNRRPPSPSRPPTPALGISASEQALAPAIDPLPHTQTLATFLDRLSYRTLTPLLHRLHRTTDQLYGQLTTLAPQVPWVTATPWVWFAQQLAAAIGKSVNVDLHGETVTLEAAQIQQWQPLVLALIRYSLCFSLESPADRQRQGKPSQGCLQIEAIRQGNQTLLVVRDDGQGFAAETLYQRGQALGLFRSEVANIADIKLETLEKLLLNPLFTLPSTQATTAAGTAAATHPTAAYSGPSLSQIAHTAQQLGGSLWLTWESGQGSQFLLNLPLSHQSIEFLCCRHQFLTVALPQNIVVERIPDLTPSTLSITATGEVHWQGRSMPYYGLNQLFALHSPLHVAPRQAPIAAAAVVIQVGTAMFMLGVEGLGEEIVGVTQPLAAPVAVVPGIAGVVVLADGALVPIVDAWHLWTLAQGAGLPGTIDLAQLPPPAAIVTTAPDAIDLDTTTPTTSVAHPDRPFSPHPGLNSPNLKPSHPYILIVDDSRTVRQFLTDTLVQLPYPVVQVPDGQAAWDYLMGELTTELFVGSMAGSTAGFTAGSTAGSIVESSTGSIAGSTAALPAAAPVGLMQSLNGIQGLNCALIISDVEMPRLNGFELVARLKQTAQFAAIPVMMLSSRSGDRHRRLAQELGAQAYLTKPYREENLLQAVKELLRPQVL